MEKEKKGKEKREGIPHARLKRKCAVGRDLAGLDYPACGSKLARENHPEHPSAAL